MKFSCPRCIEQLEADNSQAGTECTCPTCQHRFAVPKGTEKTFLLKEARSRSQRRRAPVLLAVGACLLVLAVCVAATLYSRRQQTLREEAARKATVALFAQEAQRKELLRQKVAQAYPDYADYLDNLYNTVRAVELTQGGLESTLKNSSSYVVDMWVDRLRTAKDKLDDSLSVLRGSNPPAYMNASFAAKLDELREALANLKTELQVIFTVQITTGDARTVIRVLNQSCARVGEMAHELSSLMRRDALELVDQTTLKSLAEAP